MSKKTIGIAVVAILLVLVAGVAPYWIGSKVETEFRDGIAQARTEFGYPIEVTRYERGWLHSHAVTQLRIEDKTFDIEHDITHGPLLVFGWASIHSTMPLDVAPKLDHFFDGPPLVADTRLGFGGGYRIDIHSPAFDKDVPDYPNVHVRWDGLEGHYARDDNQVDFRLGGGGLQIDDGDRHVLVEDIALSGSGSAMANLGKDDAALDWGSQFEASVGNYRVYEKPGLFDISYGMHLQANSTQAEDDTVELHAGYDITDLRVKGTPSDGEPIDIDIDNAAIKLDLTGLQADPLEQLIVAMRDLDPANLSPEQIQARTGRAVIALGPQILSGTPKLSVAIPAIETGHGQARALASVGLFSPDELPEQLKEMAREMPLMALAQRLTLDADIFVDQQLIDWTATKLASEKPAMAHDLRTQLDALVQQGLLMREDGAVGLKLHTDVNTVVLNGRTIPAQQLKPLFDSLFQ